MKTCLYIIRHGKTRASVDHVYCGKTDLPLCDEGVEEIQELKKERIYPKKAQAYYTSGMKRANQTLKLIYGEVDFKVIEELAEMNFGEFEMYSYNELVNNKKYIDWISDDSGNTCCEGGESNNEFYKRVEMGIDILFSDIIKNGYSSVVLTAHGGSIGYFARYIIDKDLSFYDSMPSQARGYKVELELSEGEKNVCSWERI